MKFEKVGQIALVVKDVEKAAEYLTKEFGIGPFTIVNFDQGKAEYKGQEVGYKSKVGLGSLGGVALELIQMIEGDIILSDPEYLPPRGQGVHHIGFFTDDAETLAAEWEKEGGKVLQRSWPLPGALTIYLDTPEYAGMLVELIQLGGAKK